MSKVLIKGSAPKKILVKSPTMTTGGKGTGMGVDYDISGKPVFVMGQGGGAGRGKTRAEKVLGRFGGAVSALGGFMGAGGAQHRSLGSALSGGIGAGYQGAQLGGQLGRFLSGRKGRAVANLKEQQAQDKAEIAAHKELGIPLPKRLGGEGPVKVQTSKPKADSSSTQVKVKTPETVTAATTNPMGITPKQAETAINTIGASVKIEPEQRKPGTNVAVQDWRDTALADNWGNTAVQNASGEHLTNLGQVAVTAAPKTPSLEGFVAEDAKDNSAANSEQVGTGMDETRNIPSTSAMEPPKANGQSTLTGTALETDIENQARLSEEKARREAEQPTREANAIQTTLFGNVE